MKNEIILYKPDELPEHIEVIIDEEKETFWLSLNQISSLFERDKSVIYRHLKNIFRDNELNRNSVVAFFATTATDGKTYNVEHFNLDAILSVGYRVNSKRGTQFRLWANRVLKDYMIKGFTINNRMNRLENNLEILKIKVNQIDLKINSELIPIQGVFFDGEIFDAYELTSRLIRSAKSEIILIDNYINESTLVHLSKKAINVSVLIYTKTIDKQLLLDVKKVNEQFGNFDLHEFSLCHDRFLIIDRNELYHFGASLKDLGKKWFAFSKMDVSMTKLILEQLNLEDAK
jgi:hypothetical protein